MEALHISSMLSLLPCPGTTAVITAVSAAVVLLLQLCVVCVG